MHIAVCNDNISYRKHLERLLKRESDMVKQKNQTLYIDSFGHPEALYSVAMMYQLFFIDMVDGPMENIKIAQKLRKLSSTGLIVFIQEPGTFHIMPPGFEEELSPISMIAKPIQPSDLHQMIQDAYAYKAEAVAPLEIRGEKETFYIPAQQILYIEFEKEMAKLYKLDGSCYEFMSNKEDLAYSLEQHPSFYVNHKYQIINVNYIEKISFGKITLTNKKILPYPFLEKSYLEGLIHYSKKFISNQEL